MTAPARSRGRVRTRPRPASPRIRQRTAAPPAVEPVTPDVATPKKRSSAAERAYARRAQRVEDLRREGLGSGEPRPQRLRLTLRWPRSRASFVLLLMALMAVGVATTLWLSTQAIADSYRLEQLRQNNAALAEQAERLQREVASAESPSSLAERAGALGMVPGGNPARLVVGEDGKVRVVGEPTRATTPAPPPDPAPEQQQDEQDRQQQQDQQDQQQNQQAGHGQQGDQSQQGDRRQEEQGTTGGD